MIACDYDIQLSSEGSGVETRVFFFSAFRFSFLSILALRPQSEMPTSKSKSHLPRHPWTYTPDNCSFLPATTCLHNPYGTRVCSWELGGRLQADSHL